MRVSKVVLSDDEIAETIRRENDGQPTEWVDEEVNKALAERAERTEAVQAEYDNPTPSQRKAT
jgi:hypothetical protein